ncbi:Hypothetical predicted protein [Olea europaea subsp. europaea]|uniref:Uncharacterized protein n=1 Tax=Olea europaea subsp. europaea TaxID=158383 RepID=A0A8S0R9I7_OLEEU|nr:Hypothetical predicted protein [Olea europaea subsp. europaea]
MPRLQLQPGICRCNPYDKSWKNIIRVMDMGVALDYIRVTTFITDGLFAVPSFMELIRIRVIRAMAQHHDTVSAMAIEAFIETMLIGVVSLLLQLTTMSS